MIKEIPEKSWALSAGFLKVNPLGILPTFVDDLCVCPNDLIACEYLDEAYPQFLLMGKTLEARIETRRLMAWFDQIFYKDVYMTLFYERALKRHVQRLGPDTLVLKRGRQALRTHMMSINHLADQRSYLNDHAFSWADIAGCVHLSCIDYLGDVPWNEFLAVKEWYMKIKSRPAFRSFLGETFSGLTPSANYHRLDF